MIQLTRIGTGTALLAVCALLSAVGVGLAKPSETAWMSAWKLVVAKSYSSGDTITFSKKTNGLYHVAAGADTDYDFGVDGKEYPSGNGHTTTWTAVGDHAWDSMTRAGNVILNKAHGELSADGGKLTITTTGTRADGLMFNETRIYARVTGTEGLVGRWRGIRNGASVPARFVISSPSAQFVEGTPYGTDLLLRGEGNTLSATTRSASFEAPRKPTYVIKCRDKPDQYRLQTPSPASAPIPMCTGQQDAKTRRAPAFASGSNAGTDAYRQV